MTELAQLIDEALSSPDLRSGMAHAKRLIRNRLAKAEPRASIYETEYFDHSFAPDLVLTQPGKGRDQERWVYLRTTNEPQTLIADLEVAAAHSTMFIVLDQFRSATEEPFHDLDRISTERDALVIDAPALTRIGDTDDLASTASVMSRALVTAGRGALGEAETTSVLTTFTHGVDGAIEGATPATMAAAVDVRRRLSAPSAARVTSFLGALWEGSGRPRAEFPGQLDSAGLDEAGLALLLSGPEIDNDGMWRRLAQRTTLAQIADSTTGAPANLQRLIKAGLDTITAHVCLLEPAGLFPSTDQPAWSWAVSGQRLSLAGPGFTAYVSARRDDLPAVRGPRVPVELDMVRRRAQQFSIPLREVRMKTASRTVGYDSTRGDDIAYDHELDVFEETLGNPTVVHVEAQITGDVRLACDFPTGTTGLVAPRALMGIGQLVATAIQLLEPLDDDEAETLRLLLLPEQPQPGEIGDEGWEQPRLFE